MTTTYPLTIKIGELRRELRTREKVYPRWVAEGRLPKDLADQRIGILKAILADYEQKVDQLALGLAPR